MRRALDQLGVRARLHVLAVAREAQRDAGITDQLGDLAERRARTWVERAPSLGHGRSHAAPRRSAAGEQRQEPRAHAQLAGHVSIREVGFAQLVGGLEHQVELDQVLRARQPRIHVAEACRDRCQQRERTLLARVGILRRRAAIRIGGERRAHVVVAPFICVARRFRQRLRGRPAADGSTSDTSPGASPTAFASVFGSRSPKPASSVSSALPEPSPCATALVSPLAKPSPWGAGAAGSAAARAAAAAFAAQFACGWLRNEPSRSPDHIA